jgi:hypothetical protein
VLKTSLLSQLQNKVLNKKQKEDIVPKASSWNHLRTQKSDQTKTEYNTLVECTGLFQKDKCIQFLNQYILGIMLYFNISKSCKKLNFIFTAKVLLLQRDRVVT